MQTITRKELEKRVGELIGIRISETETIEGTLNALGVIGKVEKSGDSRLKILPNGEEYFRIQSDRTQGIGYGLVNGSIIQIKGVDYQVNL